MAFLGTFAATGKSTSRRSAKLPLSPQEHKKGRLTPSSQAVEKACHCEPVRRLAWQSVGALRKHACGMFLASDLGGYAAVASILFFAALSRDYGFPRRFAPRNDRMGLSTRWAPLCKGSCQCEALTEGLSPCRELGNNPSVTLRGDTSPYTGDALKQMTRGDDHAAADRGGRGGSGGSADGVF